jgi:hypothetical protein
MKALSALLGLVVACVLVAGIEAQDAKEGKKVTKEGKILCGKCSIDLVQQADPKAEKTEKCCNVLQVKEGDKLVNYYLKDKGKKAAYHKCAPGSSVEATVTGTLTVADGKNFITPAEDGVKIKKAD